MPYHTIKDDLVTIRELTNQLDTLIIENRLHHHKFTITEILKNLGIYESAGSSVFVRKVVGNLLREAGFKQIRGSIRDDPFTGERVRSRVYKGQFYRRNQQTKAYTWGEYVGMSGLWKDRGYTEDNNDSSSTKHQNDEGFTYDHIKAKCVIYR